jgi:hypothetical protein
MASPSAPASIIGTLSTAALDVSRMIASFLIHLEPLLQQIGSDAVAALKLDRSLSSPTPGVESVAQQWRSGPHGPDRLSSRLWFRGNPEEFERRLIGHVAQALAETLRPRSGQRPDVLAITSRLLANPTAPYTDALVRFIVILSLRAAYDISYNEAALHNLRMCFDDIMARFAYRTRRERQTASNYEAFLIDILAMQGWIYRVLTKDNLVAYYEGFKYPFGVNPETRRREFAHSQDWPQLRAHHLPDFSTVLNLIFAQPPSIAGLDEVIGGLMPTVSDTEGFSGGLISLIAGPPGSGKTTLCLSITRRMAELGSLVSYVATEEDPYSLKMKLQATLEPRASSLWPDLNIESETRIDLIRMIDGAAYKSFGSLADEIHSDLRTPVSGSDGSVAGPNLSLYLAFPRVLVIDSVTALFSAATTTTPSVAGLEPFTLELASRPVDGSRQLLAGLLRTLRRDGVCVFLVGGPEDASGNGLAYLVDNVFSVGLDSKYSPRHPTRFFSIDKTRLQTSRRGQHILHVSRRDGCRISPSLDSVLKTLSIENLAGPESNVRAIVWSAEPISAGKAQPEMEVKATEPVSIRSKAHTLIYGRGSASKARLAIALALEPRVSVEPKHDWHDYITNYADPNRTISSHENEYARRARVLIVSFLYGPQYYQDSVVDFFQNRYRLAKAEASDLAASQLSVHDLYPGYISAETLIDGVRERLHAGILEARPYTAVIVDGVHNILVQFPLLEQEPLLWSTLFRLFKSNGLDAVSTFTFFKIASLHGYGADRDAVPSEGSPQRINLDVMPANRIEMLYFDLLVSSCDHSFLAESPEVRPRKVPRQWVRVRPVSSLDGLGNQPEEFWWNPDTFRQGQDANL